MFDACLWPFSVLFFRCFEYFLMCNLYGVCSTIAKPNFAFSGFFVFCFRFVNLGNLCSCVATCGGKTRQNNLVLVCHSLIFGWLPCDTKHPPSQHIGIPGWYQGGWDFGYTSEEWCSVVSVSAFCLMNVLGKHWIFTCLGNPLCVWLLNAFAGIFCAW